MKNLIYLDYLLINKINNLCFYLFKEFGFLFSVIYFNREYIVCNVKFNLMFNKERFGKEQ